MHNKVETDVLAHAEKAVGELISDGLLTADWHAYQVNCEVQENDEERFVGCQISYYRSHPSEGLHYIQISHDPHSFQAAKQAIRQKLTAIELGDEPA